MNDPLAQLQDIQLPEQIHQYPIAPGWWLLLLLIVAIVGYSINRYQKRKQLKQAQQQALIYAKQANNSEQIFALFKSAALAYFPRAQVAKLFGQDFYHFLALQLPAKHREKFAELSQQSFNAAYQQKPNDIDAKLRHQALNQALILWLTYALPPKQQNRINTSANNINTNKESKLGDRHV